MDRPEKMLGGFLAGVTAALTAICVLRKAANVTEPQPDEDRRTRFIWTGAEQDEDGVYHLR